jgi:uncharacterized membrane protein HdeD (DUF308 family)
METIGQNVVVIAAVVIGSLLSTVGLNAIWPAEKRHDYNDVVGWQLTILGTTYAVILGFMLFTVWSEHDEADLNVDHEASAVANIYRLAEGLPGPQRIQLQTLARSYAEAAVNQDWPQMANGKRPKQTDAISSEMWKTVMSVRVDSVTQQTVQDHALSELGWLQQHRLIRLLESTAHLPNALWCVLLVGGVLTVISACMFGVENRKLQALEVLCLSLLICLSLVAIANIHRPFRGLIHVRSYAFQHVIQSMQN